MTFLSDANKIPEPASIEKAELGLLRLIEACRKTGDETFISDIKEITSNEISRRFLAAIFGSSPFLTQCAVTDPRFLLELVSIGPELTLKKIEKTFSTPLRNSTETAVMELLRINRKHIALAIAAADITKLWSGSRVTQTLSRFGDLSIGYAINFLLLKMASKDILKLPINTNPGIGSGLIVLGMGKLGGNELNYSSDVDLVLFFDPESIETTKPNKLQQGFIQLAKGLVKLLSERTSDGYVFRTDMRLRPDPSSTPSVISVAAAEAYYESVGQNWERAAMIKARPVAGDIDATTKFLKRLRPFIWRKNLDFATISDIHLIKRQINAHKGGSVVAVEGHNVKLGRGGIREIEFFVQTQQLIWGGRLPQLRIAPTCMALVELSKTDQISNQTADELITAYWFLRRVEHHLQMIDDQQTHNLPKDNKGIKHVATFLGFGNSESFRRTLISHLNCVENHYAQLFEKAPNLDGTDQIKRNLIFTGTDDDPDTLETITEIGFSNPASIAETVRSWHRGHYRATRSTRARQLLTALIPLILKAFGETTEPNAGFYKFDSFLSRLPSGIQLFSMFSAHPEILKLVAEIMGSAPRLAEHLGRNPNVLDSVLQYDFFDHLPTSEQLDKEIGTRLTQAENIEDVLNITRRWANDRKLQIGIQALRHRASWQEIGLALTKIAEISIKYLLQEVSKEFENKHGKVKGAKNVVLALGKVGGQEMTPTSDLDLIFIYDHNSENQYSDGNYPLAPSHYFARLSQRLINAITAQTGEGFLYSVDMRLRPSGNAGPIASHISAFTQYHKEKSWTWEHMALLRARAITGTPDLIKEVEKIVKSTLIQKRDPENLRMDISKMRERIEKEHHSTFIWEIKYMRGGLVDVEFITQYLQLKNAHKITKILSTNTLAALDKLVEENILNSNQAKKLQVALKLWQTVQGMLRLTIKGYFKPGRENEIPVALTQAIARATDCANLEELKLQIIKSAGEVSQIYEGIIANPTEQIK
ncbi:MAG: bifunctional [glutamine synthetase] adenylyltransferase/[glutamine synthetase]-adenylyl-L-tyrosine phosphorylase [Pseudomonadota bacterium]|nr:bifunctional [glutamine synthetase] adenylyltransferase/[glutamine synthetase]-adenylyl-L-tyrosine phosphorylase [Pseudomonadota bacterium]